MGTNLDRSWHRRRLIEQAKASTRTAELYEELGDAIRARIDKATEPVELEALRAELTRYEELQAEMWADVMDTNARIRTASR